MLGGGSLKIKMNFIFGLQALHIAMNTVYVAILKKNYSNEDN